MSVPAGTSCGASTAFLPNSTVYVFPTSAVCAPSITTNGTYLRIAIRPDETLMLPGVPPSTPVSSAAYVSVACATESIRAIHSPMCHLLPADQLATHDLRPGTSARRETHDRADHAVDDDQRDPCGRRLDVCTGGSRVRHVERTDRHRESCPDAES